MENILNFSMYKGEPDWLYKERLRAYNQLDYPIDNAILNSFEEKDERGYGVVANLSHNKAIFIQYGSDTIFEQMPTDDSQKGIVMLDIFDALLGQYNSLIKIALENYPLNTQDDYFIRTYFNGGLFIYVPKNQNFDIEVIFVEDNALSDISVKYIIIAKEENAVVNVNITWQHFNQPEKIPHIQTIEHTIL